MRKASISMCILALAVSAAAQQPGQPAQPAIPAAKTMASSLGLYAFPAKGQTAETQQKDEAACYSWAQSTTGFDPVAAALSDSSQQAPQVPKGSGVKGAASGAAAGAAIGAITGDPGEGAAVGAIAGGIRGKMAQKKAQRRAEEARTQAQSQQSARIEGFRKAFSACMEAKGYTVK